MSHQSEESLPPHLLMRDEDRLWRAVRENDVKTVLSILSPLVSEPDTEVCQFRGVTPLHIAAGMGLDDLVDQLLAAGANVNQRTIGGHGDLVRVTPLHDACEAGHKAVCAKLIAAGANLDVLQGVCRLGGIAQGALTIAVKRDNLSIVKMLLDAGANPDGTQPGYFDSESNVILRPLAMAVFRRRVNIVKALLAAGADPDLEYGVQGGVGQRSSARQRAMQSADSEMRALFS